MLDNLRLRPMRQIEAVLRPLVSSTPHPVCDAFFSAAVVALQPVTWRRQHTSWSTGAPSPRCATDSRPVSPIDTPTRRESRGLRTQAVGSSTSSPLPPTAACLHGPAATWG